MKTLKLFIFSIALFFVSGISAQTFKCVDVSFNKGDKQSTSQRLKINKQLLGSKAVLTVYDNKILAEMYDNNEERDASFVLEYFDNTFAKGYRYTLPNSSGVIVIQDITPSIKDIKRFKILTFNWDTGMNITVTYIRI